MHADGTALPFPDGRFSAALSFIMQHHVPSASDQNRLLAELGRVLRAGGVLAGVDSLGSPEFREMHVDDIWAPVDPEQLPDRLTRAGFTDVRVEVNPYVVQFQATRERV